MGGLSAAFFLFVTMGLTLLSRGDWLCGRGSKRRCEPRIYERRDNN